MFSTRQEKVREQLKDWDSKKRAIDPQQVALIERLKNEQRQREQQARENQSESERECEREPG